MYYETVTTVTSVTSVFEVFPGEEIIIFFFKFLKKKNWNIGIGENTCHHVTHVTHSKIVINTRYEKEVFKNGKVKPKRYTRLWKKIPRNVPQIPSKISPKQ